MKQVIKKGDLFYPACGYDTAEVIAFLLSQVKTYHFCDTSAIGLPQPKFGLPMRPKEIATLNEVIPNTTIISNQKDGVIYTEKWQVNNQSFRIKAYTADALTVFHKLDKLAVFYYRGDSLAGLGSGVCWFGNDLFHHLLDKLIPGGLIITDGSNPDPKQLETPWDQLYRHSHWAFPDLTNDEVPNDFTYLNRYFKVIGRLSVRYGETFIWQVD